MTWYGTVSIITLAVGGEEVDMSGAELVQVVAKKLNVSPARAERMLYATPDELLVALRDRPGVVCVDFGTFRTKTLRSGKKVVTFRPSRVLLRKLHIMADRKVIAWKDLQQMRERGGEIAKRLPSAKRTRPRNPAEQELLDRAERARAEKGLPLKFD